jgi:hypothetical protein
MVADEFRAMMARRALRIAAMHAKHPDAYSQKLAAAWRAEAAKLA